MRKEVFTTQQVWEPQRPSSRQCPQSEWFSLPPAEHTQRLSPVAVREWKKVSLRKIRPSARELDALLDELDRDQDGFIQFDEF
ncbi:hypothetical protein FOZ60_005953 [Perkinsus olseni]|uniref:EF-hand domain-containing protein n=1 Tax=Perkinsus olseni TaxID=32597 RepID=A0A7J6NQL0_PEROL|nr:hypothetical protein FOZ60_005953 [Perkinsus olseni]